MHFRFNWNLFYEIIGKVFVWGAIIFLLLYGAYDSGRYHGRIEGYYRGYADGYFHLRPASPNLSPRERDSIQVQKPIIPKHGSTKEDGILIKY